MTVNQLNSKETVNMLVEKAKAAMKIFNSYNQEQVDEVVQALAWAIMKPGNAEKLADLSVRETGLGKYEHKVNKNRRKTLGTLRDLMSVKTVGVVKRNISKGITEIAKPVGVVAAVVPSTNPAATPINKAMMALKGRNAIIFSPSPKGASTCQLLLKYIYEELEKVGAPLDLVQALPAPISKEISQELMKQADFVTVTGSSNNVHAGQTSGTPNACVGAGNVVSIVDSTADLEAAAYRIFKSKTYDYATSCSSDNALVVEESVYDEMIGALRNLGGYLCNTEEKFELQAAMWGPDGRRKSETIAKSPEIIAEVAGFKQEEKSATFFMVEETGIGKEFPFSNEKLAVVLTVYKAKDFCDAIDITKRILNVNGKGHSIESRKEGLLGEL